MFYLLRSLSCGVTAKTTLLRRLLNSSSLMSITPAARSINSSLLRTHIGNRMSILGRSTGHHLRNLDTIRPATHPTLALISLLLINLHTKTSAIRIRRSLYRHTYLPLLRRKRPVTSLVHCPPQQTRCTVCRRTVCRLRYTINAHSTLPAKGSSTLVISASAHSISPTG